MASEEAIRLKAQWMEMPEEFFETMTFGELMPGQPFIGLPLPGDNDGHGGLRVGCRVFSKTHQRVEAVAGLSHDIPTGKAVNNLGITSYFPDSMPVILLI